MAAEVLGSIEPLFVVENGLGAFDFAGIAQSAFTIAHDEEAPHCVVLAAGFEFFEVGGAVFLFEENVDVFDSIDAVGLFGGFGKIEVGEFVSEVSFVE